MNNSKLLLVEDDIRLSSLLSRNLEEKGYHIEVACDGEEGLAMFQNSRFDLIISDLMMPKLDGVSLCREIRKQNSQIPIILLTALGATDDKVEGFDAGADDYLVKPFDIRELLVRVKSLLRRFPQEELEPTGLLVFAELEMHLNSARVFREGKEIQLTPKEFNLLKYLLEHPEKILTREEIAKEVWGMDFDTGTNFIDVYINYLRKKIDKPFAQKLIHTRTGMGFILSRTS
ncbi:response regulator transcription factor [Pleomorphovibrio marinus]|uniref:response regulator transcription factor n=1 Tax=Pleomorphovibrio marinus TaxID=2164132 RepID=UPI000E0AE58D|nr:response regulator transcription factor [Pleomorphovibrio marinus]